MIYGLILAGGRSSRFGREKAVAELGGRPLIAWIAGALSQAEALAVSARAGSGAAALAQTRRWPVLTDAAGAPQGPLAGIAAGLRWAGAAGAEGLVTAPCDTPFLPADYLYRLRAEAVGGGAVAWPGAEIQPLCALWPTSALAIVEGWTGRPAPRDVLAAMGAARVAFDADAFANLNTPADYAAAEAAARVR